MPSPVPSPNEDHIWREETSASAFRTPSNERGGERGGAAGLRKLQLLRYLLLFCKNFQAKAVIYCVGQDHVEQWHSEKSKEPIWFMRLCAFDGLKWPFFK